MSTFGVPITDETLEAMSRYAGKSISQVDRAREAMRLIHAEGKNLDALQHALGLKASYGDGVSAMVLVYNATGAALELVDGEGGTMDWYGYVYHEQPPASFQNGQWLAFLHAHPTAQSIGCEAARVFRGRDVDGQVRDFMVAWSLPWSATQNSAYTEVREKDHFPNYWGYIKEEKLEKAGKICTDQTDKNCASTVSVGGCTSSEFIAVLQHKFGPLPEE
ncbi:hypothetical protein DAI22_04g072200 [Oryza sativa Japonica Group]|jgi:hypothetical protein|nr:hypothetical protein DAI22_04g071200 [Oryza sativa Japonica Group]KAF2933308.1 hypothetical protein DAI22_04g072200 [Oryza sativa Japonica Group]